MARKAEIQYVDQFYLFGSEAPKQAPAPKKGKFKVPEHYLERFQKISVDPVALGGLIAAAVMLCLLTAVRPMAGWQSHNPRNPRTARTETT